MLNYLTVLVCTKTIIHVSVGGYSGGYLPRVFITIIVINDQLATSQPTRGIQRRNNVKARKKSIKVLNNSNSIQIRKKTAKQRFTDGHLRSFTRFGHVVNRERGGAGKHATSTASKRKGM